VQDSPCGDGYVDEAQDAAVVVADNQDVLARRKIEGERLALRNVLPGGGGGRQLEPVGSAAVVFPGLAAAQGDDRSRCVGRGTRDGYPSAGVDVSDHPSGAGRERNGTRGTDAGHGPATGEDPCPDEATADCCRHDDGGQRSSPASPPGMGTSPRYDGRGFGGRPGSGRGQRGSGLHGASLDGTMFDVKVSRDDCLPLRLRRAELIEIITDIA
jgi:hypothetical protein